MTKLPHNESEEIYGAEFSLDGIDAKIEGIINDDYVEYVIYVKTQSEATVKPRFALTADCLANTGSVFFDTFTYQTISATDYDKAQLNAPLNATFAETDLIEDNDAPEDENENNGGSVIWYVIPSLILAVALILALTGYIMRKVKFKKHTKLKRGTYDRTKTMHRDALRKEADDRRNEVIKVLKADLKTLEDELLALETENKERIANSRKEHGKQITKEDEKAFKLYASKHTKALNKIDRIKSEIEYVSSDEYLLKEIKKLQQNKR